MLRIYAVALELVPEVLAFAARIGERDRDLEKQIRRSLPSVVLNIAEGSGSRGGNRRARYDTALGSARETVANLEYAQAAGYIEPMSAEIQRRWDHVIGVLVRNVHG